MRVGVSPTTSKKTTKCSLGWSKITACERTSFPKIENKNDAYLLFFDCEGVVHKEFVPEGQTVTKEFYFRVFCWGALHVEKSQFQSSPRPCPGAHHTNCAANLGQKKKKAPVLATLCTLPIWVLRTICIPQIENGTERVINKKIFRDPEVCDGEIEDDTYSWVKESHETT